jgi:hypothetical protein
MREVDQRKFLGDVAAPHPGGVYNPSMSTARSKPSSAPPKTLATHAKTSKLVSGFPGTNEERAAQRRRFAEKHRETLRRLGK